MRRRRGMSLTAAALAMVLLIGATPPDDRALLDAAKRGDVAAVRALLKGGADPNTAQGDGLTALHVAAEKGSLELARVLISAGAKVGSVTRIGSFTPLHVAAEGAHAEIVRALLEAGADPAAVAVPSGATPLHLAAKALNGEVTIQLLLDRGAPVNALEASHGQTALMMAAAAGHAGTVRELLRRGADPGIRTVVVDVIKRMVIDRAARERLAKAIEEVRNNSPDGWDRPLTMEENQAAIEIQRQFLDSREEIEAWIGKSIDAINVDDVSTLREFSNSGLKFKARPFWEVKVGFTGGMTALLDAAREGHIGAAEALLDGGADINQVAGDGTSPLQLAAMNGQYDLAMMLIQRGADPNIGSHTDGIAPLFAVVQTQWASFTGYPQPRAQDRQKTGYLELMKALLEAGANPNKQITRHPWFWEHGNDNRGSQDINGATAFYRAAMAQDVEAMKLLAAYGADPNIPTVWDEVGMRGSREEDGRNPDDSGLPPIPEGTPNNYPIHAAAGGGWLGPVAIDVNRVPNNYLNAVKYLVEELGADVNAPHSWGYSPLHYAAVRGDIPMIDYLLSKGAKLNAVSRLGQTPVDMARGGGSGFHLRTPQPETVRHMVNLGAQFKCKNTHFRGTGHWCAGAGVPVFPGIVVVPEEPTPRRESTSATPR
jgi:uncharacterized protein